MCSKTTRIQRSIKKCFYVSQFLLVLSQAQVEIKYFYSFSTTSTHLPVILPLLHSLPKLAMVPLDARFLSFFVGRGRRCNRSRVISQHATSLALSLIKSYCPHSLCHPLCHCYACLCVYMGLYVQLREVSYRSFPVTDLKTKGCHCGRTTLTN